MGYILIGIGGGFGSITRFALGKLISEHSKTVFPRGTFIINITGAFLLGILTTIQNNSQLYWLLGDGFLGAFTTFSTFMFEGFHLFEEKEKIDSFKYVIGSLILGIIGFIIGAKIGNALKEGCY
jgi:fluoride exporter